MGRLHPASLVTTSSAEFPGRQVVTRWTDLLQKLSGPVRTCVGCRAKVDASALLRVVAVAGVVTPDPRHRLPGRGAWLHSRVECLDLAERRRAFGRALRLPSVTPESTEVREFLSRVHRKQVDPS